MYNRHNSNDFEMLPNGSVQDIHIISSTMYSTEPQNTYAYDVAESFVHRDINQTRVGIAHIPIQDGRI
jgi:hypothetical protein